MLRPEITANIVGRVLRCLAWPIVSSTLSPATETLGEVFLHALDGSLLLTVSGMVMLCMAFALAASLLRSNCQYHGGTTSIPVQAAVVQCK